MDTNNNINKNNKAFRKWYSISEIEKMVQNGEIKLSRTTLWRARKNGGIYIRDNDPKFTKQQFCNKDLDWNYIKKTVVAYSYIYPQNIRDDIIGDTLIRLVEISNNIRNHPSAIKRVVYITMRNIASNYFYNNQKKRDLEENQEFLYNYELMMTDRDSGLGLEDKINLE
jgi:hypothetical protein